MTTPAGPSAMLPVVQPASVDELAALIRSAAAETLVLDPGRGLVAAHAAGNSRRLCLQKLSSVVDYPARDMTITVEAGMTYQELDDLLHSENQQLPIDVADGQQTVGALVAGDISGPRRYGYGTLRDYVIGVEAVDGTGRVFHAGGRVVKNVAGYDLCRLLTGSRGALAILTRLTFKLRPRPAAEQLIMIGCRTLSQLDGLLEQLNRSAAVPVILDVVSQSCADRILRPLLPEGRAVASSDDGTAFADSVAFAVIAIEGTAAACAWQAAALLEESLQYRHWWCETVPAVAAPRELSQPGSNDTVAACCRAIMQAQSDTASVDWLARLSTLPSRVCSTMTMLSSANCDVFGRAGNGLLYVRPSATAHGTGPESGRKSAEEATCLQTLRGVVSDGIGTLHLLKSGTSRMLPVAPQTLDIMKSLRSTFDPHRVFAASF